MNVDILVGAVIFGYLIVYCVDRVLYLRKNTAAPAEISQVSRTIEIDAETDRVLYSLDPENERILATGR